MIGAALAVLSCLLPPVAGPIEVPFREPACRWCPGQRGVEYAAEPGTPVRAAAPGVVSFAGAVAGTRYVVVVHVDGRRATYGMLATSSATRGDVVHTGDALGTSTDRLYFGLRAWDDTPVDPAPLLGAWLGRPRLLPTDGTPGRPAPTPQLVCRVSVERLARAP